MFSRNFCNNKIKYNITQQRSWSVSIMDLMEVAVWDSSSRAGIYLLKVNNRNTRTRCELCSKLTIKTFAMKSNDTIDVVRLHYKSQLIIPKTISYEGALVFSESPTTLIH